jgi:hypothetical protein
MRGTPDRCNGSARLLFDVDRLDGAGFGSFATGILEFRGDVIVEAADREFILHLEDIGADIHTTLTADAEVLVDGGFHFPSFSGLPADSETITAGKIEKMGRDAVYG